MASTKLFHKNLHQWYQEHGRLDLPWRHTDDPYHIYISEIMLQQTQVATVLERFYFPFLEAFPSLEALADAEEQEVLKLWEGLGYYNRARNLHKAAKQTGGVLPNTLEELVALPGIGNNTAHAILAFAFHLPYPVMEANVKRIIARVFALKEPKDQEYWQRADELLDHEQPFDYNQAMMDIGATVCTPTEPHCDICPLAHMCQGKETPELFPTPKKKKKVPVRKKTILVIENGEQRFYLAKRQERFLGGLYGFPDFDRTKKIIWDEQQHQLTKKDLLGNVSHQYSHFRLEAEVYRLQIEQQQKGEWFSKKEILELPISKADEKVLRLIRKR